MFRRELLIAPLCLWAASARCADTDEARFKAQAYKPRQELSARTYSEKPYSVSEKAASRTMGNPLSPSQVRQPDMKPLVTKEPLNGKSLEAPPPMQAEPFTKSDKQVYASTASPDKRAANAERKPFVASTNKVANAAFVPAEKPKERNPLLQPRQGIKELQTDDEP
ncbi:MAG: hypothetical protein FWG50_01035 [Kiritimatiellaeota bacterium]|nr:hypothetical protein [Kiritimatiellota bacterium]